jgi:hypothetical protein
MSGIGINLVNGTITGRASGAVFGLIGAVTGRITGVTQAPSLRHGQARPHFCTSFSLTGESKSPSGACSSCSRATSH